MLSKRAAEVKAVRVSFAAELVTDEWLTGTATVEEIGSSALTISGIDFNTDERVVGGLVALANQAVEFTVGGGVAGTTYTLRVTVNSDATSAQTLIKDVSLRVN